MVPCPVCGVSAGQRCILQGGGLRFEPHGDRKFTAAEALESSNGSPFSSGSSTPRSRLARRKRERP